MVTVFGLLTQKDLAPLIERIEKQDKEIEELKRFITSLQENCYNIGGDVLLLKKLSSTNST